MCMTRECTLFLTLLRVLSTLWMESGMCGSAVGCLCCLMLCLFFSIPEGFQYAMLQLFQMGLTDLILNYIICPSLAPWCSAGCFGCLCMFSNALVFLCFSKGSDASSDLVLSYMGKRPLGAICYCFRLASEPRYTGMRLTIFVSPDVGYLPKSMGKRLSVLGGCASYCLLF